MSISKADKYSLVEGGIVKKLFVVSAPLIMTQVFQMAYNLTDMFWLGRYSSDAVAASGTVGLFLWMSMAFLMFGSMGANIGVSQNLGKRDRVSAKLYAQNSITIGAIVGILLTIVVFIFHEPFIRFFGIQEANVEQYAKDYLAIVSLSFPMAFVASAITGVFNGAGNTKVSLIIGGVGFTINMILDPILIFTAGMGVAGAGLATVIAHSFSVVLAVILLKRHRERPFEQFNFKVRLDLAVVKQIFKWVSPISIESFLFTFLTMITSLLIVYFGANAMAAGRVSSQIESLTWLIAGGFASALTSFTGQNYGAQKWERISKGFKVSSFIMAGWGLFVTLTLFFAGDFLIGIFIPDSAEIVAIGVENLKILAVIQIPACLEGVAAGVFRGQGKTIPPSITSVVTNTLRVVLAYVLVSFTDLGLTGVWIGIAAGAGVRGAWIYIWYLAYSRRVPKLDKVTV